MLHARHYVGCWPLATSGIPPSPVVKGEKLRQRDLFLSEVTRLGWSWHFSSSLSVQNPHLTTRVPPRPGSSIGSGTRPSFAQYLLGRLCLVCSSAACKMGTGPARLPLLEIGLPSSQCFRRTAWRGMLHDARERRSVCQPC